MKRKEYATAHKNLVDLVANLRRMIDDQDKEIHRLRAVTDHLFVLVKDLQDKTLPKPGQTPAPAPTPAPKAGKALENNRKPYTDDEVGLAVLMNEQGATHAQIAAVLHRTPHAVQTMLSRHRNGRPAGGAK